MGNVLLFWLSWLTPTLRVEKVDLTSRRCLTSAGTAVRYDDLLGADGVNSAVRRAMAAAAGFRSDAVDLPGQFKAGKASVKLGCD